MQRPVAFDWDESNEAEHVEEHGIPFGIAIGVFLDSRRIETEDLRPEKVRRYGERRWNTVGVVDDLCLNVTFAIGRTTMGGTIARIISARPAHRKERKRYGYDP